MSSVGHVNGVKVSPTDDPNRLVTVTASDGKTGDERIISYTSCKIVGNGSFGVVYAARMLGEQQEDGSERPESDIAIKRVLKTRGSRTESCRL